MSIEMPNIRRLMIPDPGYLIGEVDLSGADAQVVAWEANDEDLKAAFRAGLKIHHKNAIDMFGKEYTEANPGKQKALYQTIKKGVHLTNYGGSARTAALSLGRRVSEMESFQNRWFQLHPGIRDWHLRTERSLRTTRSVQSQFGFKRTWFDRIDGVLPEALAWVPQHTVAIVCLRGMMQLEEQVPEVQPLVQVHDSIVFQFPISKFSPQFLSRIRSALQIAVPYPDPLIIPWELSLSSKSWGDCSKYTWDGQKKE